MSRATQTSRTPLIIILLAMIIPTVSAYLYFDLLANSAPIAQKGAYGINCRIGSMATTNICFGWRTGNTICSIEMAMACYRGSVRNGHRRSDGRRLPGDTETYGDYGFSQACGNRKDAELWS